MYAFCWKWHIWYYVYMVLTFKQFLAVSFSKNPTLGSEIHVIFQFFRKLLVKSKKNFVVRRFLKSYIMRGDVWIDIERINVMRPIFRKILWNYTHNVKINIYLQCLFGHFHMISRIFLDTISINLLQRWSRI